MWIKLDSFVRKRCFFPHAASIFGYATQPASIKKRATAEGVVLDLYDDKSDEEFEKY